MANTGKKRGFAAMPKEKRIEAARRGGMASRRGAARGRRKSM